MIGYLSDAWHQRAALSPLAGPRGGAAAGGPAPELNVRTYVSLGGKPGIYFLSLDADSGAAVTAARRTYRLPYFRSPGFCGLAVGQPPLMSFRSSSSGS